MSWKCKVKFKIINGRVFDPTQKLDNRKQDIFVKDGQIVKPSPSEICEYKTTYDVEGMIVMAGAIDIHSHIAGGNVNNDVGLFVPIPIKPLLSACIISFSNSVVIDII